MPSQKNSLSDQIAAYNEELRRYYRRARTDLSAPPEPAAQMHTDGAVQPASPVFAGTAGTDTPPAAPPPAPAIRAADAAPSAVLPANAQPPEPNPEHPAPSAESAVSAPVDTAPAEETPAPEPVVYTAPPVAPPFGDRPPTEPASPDTPAAPERPLPTDTGHLRVRTSSARGAIPLADSVITVLFVDGEHEELLHLAKTDESGYSPVFSLPTFRRELTLQPGSDYPNLCYTVLAHRAGYFSSRNECVPVYGGVTSVQEIAMIPLPEAGGQGETIRNPGQSAPDLG